jgi:hypothetical protein
MPRIVELLKTQASLAQAAKCERDLKRQQQVVALSILSPEAVPSGFLGKRKRAVALDDDDVHNTMEIEHNAVDKGEESSTASTTSPATTALHISGAAFQNDSASDSSNLEDDDERPISLMSLLKKTPCSPIVTKEDDLVSKSL